MQDRTFRCPQCGEPAERLCEGYCEPCRDANQAALDQHNAEHGAWEAMTDAQRGLAIRAAVRRG
ncbi:hypothetical protein [Microcystis phage Mae-Yong1326-1]|nr:hypothetical protein [Microcystis phage Mae-Yong1326-1]